MLGIVTARIIAMPFLRKRLVALCAAGVNLGAGTGRTFREIGETKAPSLKLSKGAHSL